MASGQTTNYGLHKWAAKDPVLREEFNDNSNKIDAALAKCGNCRIVTGTYTGNGKFGSANSIRLSFDGSPQLLFVSADDYGFCMWCGRGHNSPTVTSAGNAIHFVRMTWSSNSVSWYNDSYAPQQMNESGKVYRFMALIDTKG